MIKEESKADAPTKRQLTQAELKDLGTSKQRDIYDDYPTTTKEDKLRAPLIEKMNGNIVVYRQQDYERAIGYYSKALLALRLISGPQDTVIEDQETFDRLKKEVEIPTCLNLGLAYLKVKDYQQAIKYSSQVLSEDPQNSKALYRRGYAYMSNGDLDLAKEDLKLAYEITKGKEDTINKAIAKLKEQYQKQRNAEIEFNQRIFTTEGNSNADPTEIDIVIDSEREKRLL